MDTIEYLISMVSLELPDKKNFIDPEIKIASGHTYFQQLLGIYTY